MTNEPTADQISRAWTAAIECEGIGGARAETRQELRRLRDLKFTWFGEHENNLRHAVDAWLRGER